ncbi:hypothetical protein CKAN_00722500 [Cinnamomum micranthum f. kanehirae]|uniref:Uncharacterized protein n=1 Tax=Cinnamomum micranthum f. kanehirae TaxID=337451 RepID=A0A3S3Q3J1_9MAGN|nr:hypothetical protein CKAN_00722500 [Cinnamomum micranthum f. kanehirae]
MARFDYSEGPIRQRNIGNSLYFHCHKFQSNNWICAFSQCWSRFVGFFTKTWMKVSAKLGREMKDDERCCSMEIMEVDHEIEGIENESKKHSIMTVESVFEGDEVPSS